MLGGRPANFIPSSFGSDKDVIGNLDRQFIIHQTSGNPYKLREPAHCIRHGTAAVSTKIYPKTGIFQECPDKFFTLEPAEILFCQNQGSIGGCPRCFTAFRTMALVQIGDFPRDFKGDTAAKT